MHLLARRRQQTVAVTRPLPPPLQRTASSDLREFRGNIHGRGFADFNPLFHRYSF